MTTMRAARFDSATREFRVRDVPVPQPGPTEVRVRVMACGICLSDVHLVDGSLRSSLPELTPGHEASGVIDAVGALVPRWQPEQRVVMSGGKACGGSAPTARWAAARKSACASRSWGSTTTARGRSTSWSPSPA